MKKLTKAVTSVLALFFVLSAAPLAQPVQASTTESSYYFIWPVNNPSVTYGYRPPSRRGHNGLDIISNDSGTQNIMASRGGTVYRLLTGCGNHQDGGNCNTRGVCRLRNTYGGVCNWQWGNAVILRHDGALGIYFTGYAHLRSICSSLYVGKVVNQGDIIGVMGNTGRSFGTHLHFETWSNAPFGGFRTGYPLNPRDVLGVEVSARPGEVLTTSVTVLNNSVRIVTPRNNRVDSPINPHPYSAAAQGQTINSSARIHVTGRTYNIHGNRWYRFTYGGQTRWIYSGNVRSAAAIQRQELTTSVTHMSSTEFHVAPRDNAARARINPHPYAASHAGVYLDRDTAITVVAHTNNRHGNRWYRFTHNGITQWIYSGNVRRGVPARTISARTDRASAVNGQTINFTATTCFDATRVTLFFDGTDREYVMTRGAGGTTWTLSHNNLRNGSRTATVHAYSGNTRVATGRVNFTVTPR